MQAWNVDPSILYRAAESVGVRMDNLRKQGRAIAFRLKTTLPVRYGRRSQQVRTKAGELRRVPGAVCWHGHRAFMRAVFAVNPEARIKTALADYHGVHQFEETHSATAGQGNGYNLAYGSACYCGAAEELRTSTVRVIRQSDLLACPHVILMPDHYRLNGSCRCDDVTHSDMAEGGYVWHRGLSRWVALDNAEVAS